MTWTPPYRHRNQFGTFYATPVQSSNPQRISAGHYNYKAGCVFTGSSNLDQSVIPHSHLTTHLVEYCTFVPFFAHGALHPPQITAKHICSCYIKNHIAGLFQVVPFTVVSLIQSLSVGLFMCLNSPRTCRRHNMIMQV